MNVFEAVRENVTARQVAEFYGIKIRRNMACCPIHPDRTPSMKLDKRYHCFGCGADGDAIDFVANYFNLSKLESAKKIAEDFGIAYEEGRKAWHWRPTKEVANAKPRLSPEEEYQKAEDHCYRVYCDYYHLLKEWKETRAPRNFEEFDEGLDELFVEACHKLDYIEYVLDEIFLSASLADRVEFVRTHGKEVKNLERRIQGFTQGTAGSCSTSGEGTEPAGATADQKAKPEHGIYDRVV